MLKQQTKEILKLMQCTNTFPNTILNLFEYFLQNKRLLSQPQVVDIVITKKCNLECCFCKKYQSGSDEISLENFEKIASQLLPYARKLKICSGGEPFLHKDFINILRVAKKYNVLISVISNGMSLKDNVISEIVKEGLIDSLSFSIDGISSATVEDIRKKSKLSKIIININKVIYLKKMYEKKIPEINIRYALMKRNIGELIDAVSYWGNLGISNLICNYVSLCDNIDKNESLYFHPKLTENVFRKASIKGKEYSSLKIQLPPLINDKNKYEKFPKKCIYPWTFVMVDTDGRLFPCYNSWGAIVMGNFFTNHMNFREVWNDQTYLTLRRTVNNGTEKKMYSYCSICPARYGVKTQALHFGDDLFFKNLNIDKSSINEMKAHRLR